MMERTRPGMRTQGGCQGPGPAGPCARGRRGTSDFLSSLEGCRGKFDLGCEAKNKNSISSSKMYTESYHQSEATLKES